VPVETWPLHAWRRDDRHGRAYAAYMARKREQSDAVLDAIRTRGALATAEVEDPSVIKPKRGRWNWSVTKLLLEGHLMLGRLAVAARRPDYSRSYDLAERVIPAEHHGREISREEAHRELLRRAARAHGVGTIDDLADYYRILTRDARPRIAELVEEGTLRPVRVEGWKEPAYLHVDARAPRRIDRAALLSPFDPVVWHRRRGERLFDFDYRIEIYTPKAKRRFGYYVLPFLLGDRIVGRVDLKANRAERQLLVLASHVESHADAGEVATALAGELSALGAWLGLDEIVVARRGNLSRSLGSAVRA
jgi:uncharacterized protein